MPNILEYIDELIEQGYSDEDAAICADCLYSDYFDRYDDDEGYYVSDDEYYEMGGDAE